MPARPRLVPQNPNPKKHLTQEKKSFALAMLNCGKTQLEVAAKMRVSQSTIKRLARKARVLPEFVTPKRKSGTGPRKRISLVGMLKMKRFVVRYPATSARKLKQKIPELADVSIRSVQNTLKNELNLPSRRPAKKPMLTQQMKDKRLAFARSHLNWTVEQWKGVHFTDESTFRVVRSCGSMMVRRSPGSNRYASKFTIKTVKHAASVMAWGGFSAAGLGGASTSWRRARR